MKRKRSPCLVIPIETKVRELHAKFYMACVAAENGFEVIIGGANHIRDRICWLPKGSFFLDKSVAPSRAVWFNNYRNLGLRPVAWCEEGLTFCDEDEYLRRKVDGKALSNVECFFAWGPYQAELIKKRYPAFSAKIHEMGNPRIDLLSPCLRNVFKKDVEQIRAKYPRMVLINTNFSLCNHKNGEGGFLADLKANGKVKTVEDEQFALAWVAHKQKLFDAFKQIIPILSSTFPDNTFVVRPHPSERHETWDHHILPLPNVVLKHEGNIIPWLMAADAVLHNGCTTGLEGALLGRCVIAYQPVKSEIFDFKLPNMVSIQAENVEDVIRQLNDTRSSAFSCDLEHVHHIMGPYLSSLHGDASDSIVRHLVALWRITPTGVPLNKLLCASRRAYWKLTFSIRPRLAYSAHQMQKFPGLTLEEVKMLLRTFRDCTGRFSDIEICHRDTEQYLIYNAIT
jgi:surface carbohydrate biosynthesis protein